MTLHQQDIDQHIALLARYHSRLASLLQQSTSDTALVASTESAREIEVLRGEITRIETYLREHDVQFENKMKDDLFLLSEPIQEMLGDIVLGDKISGDKVEGDKQVTYNNENFLRMFNTGSLNGPFIGINYGSVISNYVSEKQKIHIYINCARP